MYSSPVLDYDVIISILDFVQDWRTVLRVMCTCWSLHKGGLPNLLGRPVKLRTRSPEMHLQENPETSSILIIGRDRIESFLQFLLADSERRPALLRTFHIKFVKSQPPPSLTLLENVLRNCSALQELFLLSSETLFAMDPALVDAMAGLRTIKEVYVRNIGPFTRRFLLSSQSSIIEANLEFNPDGGQFTSGGGGESLLDCFSDSLQTLTVCYAVWGYLGTQCTSLKHLRVMASPLLPLRDLLHIYPSLEHLEIFDGCSIFDPPEEGRSNGIIGQQHPRESFLRCIDGFLDSICALAPHCRFEHMIIRMYSDHATPLWITRLEHILSTCQPRRVELYSDACAVTLPAFASVFQVQSVEHLDLSVLWELASSGPGVPKISASEIFVSCRFFISGCWLAAHSYT